VVLFELPSSVGVVLSVVVDYRPVGEGRGGLLREPSGFPYDLEGDG
jgi:hypothetical protein